MTNPNITQDELDKFRWFHRIDFGNGVVSPGLADPTYLMNQANIYFDDIIAGASFLDIGCWDGFNSIEAARRGARRVLATDHFAWSADCWGNRGAFELARAALAPQIEAMDIDLPDLTVERLGTFDVVLFAGVLYHLRHPFYVLEQVTKLADKVFVIETHMDAAEIDRPAMIMYPGAELNGDPTNWWGPNRACIEAMLRDCGFRRIEFQPNSAFESRGVFRAFR